MEIVCKLYANELSYATVKAATAIIQDTRRLRKDGTFPVKLRVTYNREQKYYSTPHSLSIADFEKAQGNRPRNEFKDIALRLQAIERKAADIIKDLPLFSWVTFERHFLGKNAASSLLSEAFKQYADELRKEGRIGTAVSYECAQSS
jgi:integrase/recombinase XerD